MQVLLPPNGAMHAASSLAKRTRLFAPAVQLQRLQQPVTCINYVGSSSVRQHLVALRCRPADAPQAHPDWPRNPERYQGLRDEDVIELEQFLQMYQRSRVPSTEEGDDGPGEVHLVGTGPGDPGLLTLRALQLMQTADVVLYDRLVSDDILRLVGPQARMVYVGKHSGFHTRSQDEIHSLLLAFAEAGASVIRLKGGDPYVFGRGGEEVQYLAARGIQVHCVPGITAASGICAELGIPMTHRGVATSVRFLTGHARDGDEQALLDSTVAGAADPHTTLVVYMGLQTLPTLYGALAEHGMSADVPAVAVERGTTRRQRVAWGTVGELPGRAIAAGLKSPTLIIIGQVVALAPGWQQWQATGRPIMSPARLPRHGYSLPTLDATQLQQAVTASQPTAAPRSRAPAGEEGIRTREVLPGPATPSTRGSPTQLLERSPSPAPELQRLPAAARPVLAVQRQVEQVLVAAQQGEVQLTESTELGQPQPRVVHVEEAGVLAGQEEGPASGGCGGEDDACPLPFATSPAPSRPACGEDDACPLPV